jgi:hypothetical protein
VKNPYLRSSTEWRLSMFIVLETHGGAEYAIVVTDEDGNNKVFEKYEDALEEAEKCQEGLIVEV